MDAWTTLDPGLEREGPLVLESVFEVQEQKDLVVKFFQSHISVS